MLSSTLTLATIGLLYKLGRSALPYIGSTYKFPHGQYVIIHGCTDGIGKQFAKYLSKSQVPLVLVGRNFAKLEGLVGQLSKGQGSLQEHGRFKIVCLDFGGKDLSYERYQQQIDKLGLGEGSVSGIINCCGTAFVQKYSDLSSQQIRATKQVNTSPLQFCLQTMSHKMVSPKSFILNISSYTSHFPLKYSSVYSAAKAYNSNLVQAYAMENPSTRVLSVEPWYVSTKMTGFRKGWDCVTPEDVVNGAVTALSNPYVKTCAGTIKHDLIREFGFVLEKAIFQNMIEQNYNRVLKLKSLRQKRSASKGKQPNK